MTYCIEVTNATWSKPMYIQKIKYYCFVTDDSSKLFITSNYFKAVKRVNEEIAYSTKFSTTPETNYTYKITEVHN